MKRNTIRFTLFLTYSLIIFISFTAMALFFSLTEAPKLKAQTLASLKQSGEAITASIDSELTQMNMVALNIAYSNLVKSRFLGYINKSSLYEEVENTKVLGDLLTAIIGPNRPVDQINLYAPDGTIIASGLQNGTYARNARAQTWYDKVLSSPNQKAIVYAGTDEQLKKYFTNPQSQQFVSFAMRYYDSFNNPQGFIETKKNVRKVFAAAYSYKSVYGEQVYLIEGPGTVVYPLGASPADDILSSLAESNYAAQVRKPTTQNGREYVLCSSSALSDFHTVIVISESRLLQPVYSYTRNIVFITICALAIALLLAYFAAQYITKPIGEIYGEVIRFDLSTPYQRKNVQTNIIELKTLSDSFADMQEKLIDSLNKQLLMQNQEMQSHMLALQSQMNPHFLYNSIAAIASMAEEEMNREIIIMCLSMSNILRYISSDTKQEVPLEDEIHYTQDYLSCMMIRYQGDLSYAIDIPEQMNAIKVPKLCVQLLVENAIKFSSTKRPPYVVTIAGKLENKQYELSISDNGPGFREDALRVIREKIEEIDKTGLLPSLEINGMGLLNVYIRYKLLHGADIVFRVENNVTGGACVTIGGTYD